MIGQTISHYKILEKLGEGGMGVVYKAHDTKLDRLVALKFLPHGILVSEEDKARFLQEARAASAVMHPNVCVIHDISEHEGQQFIVMEFVDGKTLRQIIPVQKIQDAMTYAIQIGEALQEAHSKGVVHRDVKTDNIMVNTKNQIKVMDFGLAKLKGSLKLTRTSSTVGTLAYMAPEQIQGGEVDARSDIFSFGVVLYEMLTGQLPFRGEHQAAMVYSIVNEEPDPIAKNRPEVSSELVHIINRALEKDPEDRYQTVHEMVIDLRRAKKETSRVFRAPIKHPLSEQGPEVVTAEHGASVAKEGKMRQRPILWAGLVGILVLLAVLFVFVLAPKHVPKLNPSPTMRTLEISLGQISYPSLSRDGSWIAFAARDDKNEWAVYFMNVAKGNPRRLTTEAFEDVGYAEISPDNSEVLYDRLPPGATSACIYIVSSLGGSARKVGDPATSGRWRPDGRLIGYVRGLPNVPGQSGKREFWTVNPDGSNARLAFVDSLSDVVGNFCFDWSPEGKYIAWLRSSGSYSEIIIHDLESGKERQLTSYNSGIDEIAWASNDRIFFSSNKGGNTNVWMIPASGGEAVQVTKGTGPDIGVRISGDGKRLLYMERRSIGYVWTADIDGGNPRQLTFDNQNLGSPSFSPDKKRISFTMSSADALHPGNHIFTMQSDGTDRIQATTGEGWSFAPAWSPDGKYLAYGSKRIEEPYDSIRLYVIETSNPTSPELIGNGLTGVWIGNEKLYTNTPPWLAHTHSALHFLNKSDAIEVSEDSTWHMPLQDGSYALVRDCRKGREGWWLKTAGTGQGEAPKRLLSSEYLWSAWLSTSLRYLLYSQTDGELWRISLPDGKREKLPKVFNGLNPFGLDIQTSFDDKQAVFLKRKLDARLVLIENVFE